MPQFLRNILAALAGLFLGGFLNGTIIHYSHLLVPPPPGTDLKTEAGLLAAMHLMGPEHFIMPFLAHALGTLAGAMLATRLSNSFRPALTIALLFLAGGSYMVYILPSPLWFSCADLGLAYLPMAWLGYRLARVRVTGINA